MIIIIQWNLRWRTLHEDKPPYNGHAEITFIYVHSKKNSERGQPLNGCSQGVHYLRGSTVITIITLTMYKLKYQVCTKFVARVHSFTIPLQDTTHLIPYSITTNLWSLPCRVHTPRLFTSYTLSLNQNRFTLPAQSAQSPESKEQANKQNAVEHIACLAAFITVHPDLFEFECNNLW